MLKFIDFHADWCGPCQIMEPIINEIRQELSDRIKFEKVNVDEAQDRAAKAMVMSIPTFIIYKDDQELARRSGATSKEDLIGWIQKQTDQK